MRQGITVVGLLTLLVSCAPGPELSEPAVEAAAVQEPASEPVSVAGIWRLVETTGPDGTPTPHQAGFMVFTRNHYMAVYDVADAPRQPLPEGGAAQATSDELRATYGGFNAASGTYELSGGPKGEITIRDQIALAPGRTAPDAFLVLSYEVDGDTYRTTPLRTHAGTMGAAGTFVFTRIE